MELGVLRILNQLVFDDFDRAGGELFGILQRLLEVCNVGFKCRVVHLVLTRPCILNVLRPRALLLDELGMLRILHQRRVPRIMDVVIDLLEFFLFQLHLLFVPFGQVIRVLQLGGQREVLRSQIRHLSLVLTFKAFLKVVEGTAQLRRHPLQTIDAGHLLNVVTDHFEIVLLQSHRLATPAEVAALLVDPLPRLAFITFLAGRGHPGVLEHGLARVGEHDRDVADLRIIGKHSALLHLTNVVHETLSIQLCPGK